MTNRTRIKASGVIPCVTFCFTGAKPPTIQVDIFARKVLGLLDDYLLAKVDGVLRQKFGPESPEIAELKNRYAGATFLILGNGPSLNDVPAIALQKFITFGSNGIFKLFVPDLYMTVSLEFVSHYSSEIASLRPELKFLATQMRGRGLGNSHGTKYVPTAYPAKKLTSYKDRVQNPVMFSTNPAAITYLGGTVIFAQMQLALYMGASKILLAGVDHNLGPRGYENKRVEANDLHGLHFDSSYLPPKSKAQVDVAAADRAFQLAKKALRRANVEVWNLSSSTKLTTFPRALFDSFL